MPPAVRSDCAGWLADVEKSLPTVVLSAKDPAGGALLDVEVSVDGQPFATKLDGEALAANPGLHTFRFDAADGTHLEQPIVVRQGERNQAVAVVLPIPGKAAPAPAAAPPPAAAPAPASAAPAASTGGSASGGWMTPTGWVLGAAGVVGLGIGAVFGFVSMNDKNGAHCDASNYCDAGALSSGRSAATGADVGFIAGGVLLAGGVSLLLLAPGAGHETGATIRLAPLVGAGTTGAAMGGTW